MNQTIESKNKALVLEAFDALFNKHDYVVAKHDWSSNNIQHSAPIATGSRCPVQSHYEDPAVIEVRTGDDRG
jgi:hypothetical protein